MVAEPDERRGTRTSSLPLRWSSWATAGMETRELRALVPRSTSCPLPRARSATTGASAPASARWGQRSGRVERSATTVAAAAWTSVRGELSRETSCAVKPHWTTSSWSSSIQLRLLRHMMTASSSELCLRSWCWSIVATAPAPTAKGARRSSLVRLTRTLKPRRRTWGWFDCMTCTSTCSRSLSWPWRESRPWLVLLICSSCSRALSLSSAPPVVLIPSSMLTPPSATMRWCPASPFSSTLTSTLPARCRACASGCDLEACTSADSTPFATNLSRVGGLSHRAEMACMASDALVSASICTMRRMHVSSTWTLCASTAIVRLASAAAAAAAASLSSPLMTEVRACAPPARWKERAWLRSCTRLLMAEHTPRRTVASLWGEKRISTSMAMPLLSLMTLQNLSSVAIPPIATDALLRRSSFLDVLSILSSLRTESCLISSSLHLLSPHSMAMISAAISAGSVSLLPRCPMSPGSTSVRRRNSLDLRSDDLPSATMHRSAARAMVGSELVMCLTTAISLRASLSTSHTGWSSHMLARTWSAGPTLVEFSSIICSSCEKPGIPPPRGACLASLLSVGLTQSSSIEVPPMSKRAWRALSDTVESIESSERHTSVSDMWLWGEEAMVARTPMPLCSTRASLTTSIMHAL
mmetsp:Transcript_37958/g.95126  ORF Transcript_37958/g.95126 Transcript_37958/m.95126 type:complete len:642 (+) Transcript_37958:723-2648(+)